MMQSQDGKPSEGVKVVDRRKFNPDGTIREDAMMEEEAPSPAPSAELPPPEKAAKAGDAAPESGGEAAPGEEGEEPFDPSRIRATPLVSLMFSLATSAQMALGDIPHPATGQRRLSVDEAQGYIDILEDLKRKTRGNLEKDEERLLTQVLYELQMRFVARQQELLQAKQKRPT